MGRIGIVKVGISCVSLKSIVPIVPKNEEEKQQLVEDLTWMECEGLLVQPWGLKSEAMAQKFLQERSNEWEGTTQRDPEQWIVESKAKVYSFWKENRGLVSQTNKYIHGIFSI